jgi:hypothetical protein
VASTTIPRLRIVWTHARMSFATLIRFAHTPRATFFSGVVALDGMKSEGFAASFGGLKLQFLTVQAMIPAISSSCSMRSWWRSISRWN